MSVLVTQWSVVGLSTAEFQSESSWSLVAEDISGPSGSVPLLEPLPLPSTWVDCYFFKKAKIQVGAR